MCADFGAQKNHPKKDIQNLPTSVAMRNQLTTANFDTFPRTKFLSFHVNFWS